MAPAGEACDPSGRRAATLTCSLQEQDFQELQVLRGKRPQESPMPRRARPPRCRPDGGLLGGVVVAACRDGGEGGGDGH